MKISKALKFRDVDSEETVRCRSCLQCEPGWDQPQKDLTVGRRRWPCADRCTPYARGCTYGVVQNGRIVVRSVYGTKVFNVLSLKQPFGREPLTCSRRALSPLKVMRNFEPYHHTDAVAALRYERVNSALKPLLGSVSYLNVSCSIVWRQEILAFSSCTAGHSARTCYRGVWCCLPATVCSFPALSLSR